MGEIGGVKGFTKEGGSVGRGVGLVFWGYIEEMTRGIPRLWLGMTFWRRAEQCEESRDNSVFMRQYNGGKLTYLFEILSFGCAQDRLSA